MTCTQYESALALYVEGDLGAAEAGALEQHLGACGRCQAFLRELEASQRALKTLVTEMVDARALASVRARVRSALAAPTPLPGGWRARSWRLALAAGFALSAFSILGAWVVWRARTIPPGNETRAGEAPAPRPDSGRATDERLLASPSTKPLAISTPGRGARVFVRREVERVPVFGLSSEDADQLARAVVAISKIERVPEEQEPTPEPVRESPALVRLATADPDVVIYWQLDANGG